MQSTQELNPRPAASPSLPVPPPNRAPQSNPRIQSAEAFGGWSQAHTPNQELKHFGDWVGDSIWVPPKDTSHELSKSILNRFGPFASKETSWKAVVKQHRSEFTQVRQFELPQASIRLPKGRLFVAITERKDFDSIEEKIPACVQTRLDEFLDGLGKKRGVKVYYLKPLCVESGNELIFTTAQEIDDSIKQVQDDVFREYRRRLPLHLLRRVSVELVDAALAVPRTFLKLILKRKKREIESFHSRLEFERRRRAMEAVRMYNRCRADKCTFDEVENLTSTPDREEVIEHYVQKNELSRIDREMFKIASSTSLPWFATLSLATYKLAAIALTSARTSVSLCDPVFVAEMPGARGKLLKIGHFDEVDGVMHVEI